MAHSLSAKKRIRQSMKRRALNRVRKEIIKNHVKAFGTAVTAGDWKKAEEELRVTTKTMARVATKGTLHKNTAARKRSRLTKRLNVARATKGTKAA